MKEIKTNGITILLVEVTEDSYNYEIERDMLLLTQSHRPAYQDMIMLPSGQYQILGKSIELSKEQMKEMCEKEYFQGYFQGFCNYMSKQVIPLTVQESYLSLLEANGIVDRINIPEPNIDDYCYTGSMKLDEWAVIEYEKELKKYQEAQSKVKHYLVLKMI